MIGFTEGETHAALQPTQESLNQGTIEPGPDTVVPVMANPVTSLLGQCEAHLKAKRLTTGAGGNALDCYLKVLELQSDQPEALEELVRIERIYAQWANLRIDQNNIEKAAENISRLRSVNVNNPELAALDSRLDALIVKQQQQQQAQEQGQA